MKLAIALAVFLSATCPPASAHDGTQQQSFFPVLCFAEGTLVCGVVFASIGAMTGNELATCILAAVGMVGGSVVGGYIGSRWHLARSGLSPIESSSQ